MRRLAAHTWNTEAPTEPEWPVPVPSAVDKVQLRLKPIAARRKRNRNGEVSGPRVEIGGELFAQTVERPASFWQGNCRGRTIALHGPRFFAAQRSWIRPRIVALRHKKHTTILRGRSGRVHERNVRLSSVRAGRSSWCGLHCRFTQRHSRRRRIRSPAESHRARRPATVHQRRATIIFQHPRLR